MRSSSHRTPFILAITLHALILTALVVHLSSPDMRNLQLQPDVDIIKAVAVNPADVEAQVTRMKADEQKKQQQAQEEALKQQQEQARAQAELQHQQAAKAAAEAAKQKAAQVAAQKQAEQKAEAAALLAQQQAEQKTLQNTQTQQTAATKKQPQPTKDQKATPEKTQPTPTTTKQAPKDSQKKQQQQKAAQELKLAQQKELDNQIAAEQKQLEAARTKDQQTEIDKYTALILHTMRQNWIVPEGVNPDISCQLAIRLNSDGTVVSVTLLRSSGNTALDNSARLAVFKSSPLPVPADAKLFNDVFRQFNLTVSPKDIQG